MRILVTGARGFAGRHLLSDLSAAGHTPLGFDLQPLPQTLQVESFPGDLRNPEDIAKAVRDGRPDACIHLGGIAFVPMGWTHPDLVLSVNLGGTINILETLRQQAPATRLLVVTSAEVYGHAEQGSAIDEDAEMHPSTIYAVAKLAADLTALLYARKHGMPVMTARPGNHMGPGQATPFVTASFAQQLAEMRAGRQPAVLRVGNLDSERDFTDVRDTVRAYRLLIERGVPGRAYNIATSARVRIGGMLNQLCARSGVNPRIEVDPARFRPTDRPTLLDTGRIRADTGWTPEIPLSRTLADIMEDWNARVLRDQQTSQ
ncbi:MAG: GDP-6-deoxy-D-mannose reductase [Verrucomicrobia bacterium ADurb.Bin345]|nr:MAG: GDP-6-deoxy-D-mannose reductase [Verrucomicrobia bacterium ADurb.Bin345]